jgi:hypothetical protein
VLIHPFLLYLHPTHRVCPLSPKAAWLPPCTPFSSARLSGCRAVSFPHCWPRRVPSLLAPLTCVAATYVARRGYSSIRPLPQHALVGLPCRALPHRQPRRAPSLPALLTCVVVTYVAHSLAVRSSPITVGRAADPTMAVGAHMSWRLRSSPAEPRAPTNVGGAGGARAPPAPTPTAEID